MKKLIFGTLLIIFAEMIYALKIIPHSFGAHMILHMIVVAIAPAFMAFGLPGPLKRSWSEKETLFSPLSASVFELLLVWAWHAPGLHHFARSTSLGFFLEQSSFVLAGLWLWVSCVVHPNKGLAVIGLLLTSMHMTFLGALISLASHPLYHHPLEEQQLGGSVMLVIGGITYLCGGIHFARSLLKFVLSKESV